MAQIVERSDHGEIGERSAARHGDWECDRCRVPCREGICESPFEYVSYLNWSGACRTVYGVGIASAYSLRHIENRTAAVGKLQPNVIGHGWAGRSLQRDGDVVGGAVLLDHGDAFDGHGHGRRLCCDSWRGWVAVHGSTVTD